MKKQIKTISPILNGVCIYDWKKQRLFNSRVNLVRARRASNSDVVPNIRVDKTLLNGYDGNVNAVINRLNGRKQPTVGELFQQQIAKIKKSDLSPTYKIRLIKHLRQVAETNGAHRPTSKHEKVYSFIGDAFTWYFTIQGEDYWFNAYRKLQSKNI